MVVGQQLVLDEHDRRIWLASTDKDLWFLMQDGPKMMMLDC